MTTEPKRTIPIRFPPTIAATTRRLAKRENMTISAWIRREVDREIARRDSKCPTCGKNTTP